MFSLLDHGSPQHRRLLWVFDDFLDSPVLHLGSKKYSKTLTAAETPSSVFAAIPFALQYGYRYLQLGHERSADTGQVIWDKTGENINHQWGKSLYAEELINDYIQKYLVDGLCYYSILKPVYDVVIFNLLRRDLGAIINTHSCNEKKPWCYKCPKCAYVWLNYMAWLPTEIVNQVFDGVNLFNIEENQISYRQLVGASSQLPFECIGQAEESQLAFELCRLKGISGRAMDMYKGLNLQVEMRTILDKYTEVDQPSKHFPSQVWDRVLPQFVTASNEARNYLLERAD